MQNTVQQRIWSPDEGVSFNNILLSSYVDKVLGTNPLVYFPLWDTAAGSVEDIGPNSWDGAGYIDVEPDPAAPNNTPFLSGSVAPYWDGVTAGSRVNLYSAAFQAAFPGQEGTWMSWVRLKNAAVTWPDATARYYARFVVDADNRIELAKSNGVAQGRVGVAYWAGGVKFSTHLWNFATIGFADWFMVAMTWSLSGDYNKVYVNGQEIASRSGLGTWAGVPLANTMYLGQGGASLWYGWQAHAAIWSRALPDTTMAYLANGLGTLDDPSTIAVTYDWG